MVGISGDVLTIPRVVSVQGPCESLAAFLETVLGNVVLADGYRFINDIGGR
jgi:hypothetical protein